MWRCLQEPTPTPGLATFFELSRAELLRIAPGHESQHVGGAFEPPLGPLPALTLAGATFFACSSSPDNPYTLVDAEQEVAQRIIDAIPDHVEDPERAEKATALAENTQSTLDLQNQPNIDTHVDSGSGTCGVRS